jgi:hypothetical protein
MSQVLERLASARAKWTSGDVQGSYRELSGLFACFPDLLEGREEFCNAVELLAELTRAFGAHSLADLVAQAACAPDDVNTLFEAAYGLFEEQQFRPAATLLMRANRVRPSLAAVVNELATSLHELMLYRWSVPILDESGLCEHEPLCAYLSCYSRLMSGQVEAARERLAHLSGELEDPLPAMRENLVGMLARADAILSAGIALGDLSLTAWQAVINGTLLLHESPQGYEDAMRGRYAYLGDGPSLVRTGLNRLRQILPAVRFQPTRVVAAPGRQSEIVAAAAGLLLGLPCLAWEPGLEEEGLVVAWTLESVESEEFLVALHTHRPGARLFVHASCWTQPFGYSPDITTLLYQHIADPWTGGGLRYNPQTECMEEAPPDERDVADLAAEIAAAVPDESQSSLDLVLGVARAMVTIPDTYRPGFCQTHGKRLRQRAGGPVLSNHL